eukprot:s911_g1.t1
MASQVTAPVEKHHGGSRALVASLDRSGYAAPSPTREDSLPTDPAPTPSGQGQDEGDSSPGSLRHLPPSGGGGGLPRPSGLPQVAFELEEAEEFRSLQQAKVAERLQSQICAGRRQAASSDGSHRTSIKGSLRRTKSGSKLQVKLGPVAQSERQKGLHEPLSEKALLDTLRGLCESPGTPLNVQLVEQVLLAAEEFLYYGRHEAIAELRVPEASEKSGPEAATTSPNRVVVVGDLHGQLQDLLWIFQKHGLPSESQRFLFNGDVADRGRNAIETCSSTSATEIFVVIFGFMVSMPGSVHMNRGNHEEEGMNCASVGGFYNECLSKYGRTDGGRIFDAMKQLYALLPLATVIEKSVFVVHGGLSRCAHPLRLLRSLHERPSSLPTEPATAAEQVGANQHWPYGLVGDEKSYARQVDGNFFADVKNSSFFLKALKEDAGEKQVDADAHLKTDDAREHLINIALDGFSPVSSSKQDEGAQMASEENVAGIIPKMAKRPGLWPDVFHETDEKYVLVASTHHVRLLICEVTDEKYVLVASTHHVRLLICEVRFVQSACHVVGRQGLRKFVAL